VAFGCIDSLEGSVLIVFFCCWASFGFFASGFTEGWVDGGSGKDIIATPYIVSALSSEKF